MSTDQNEPPLSKDLLRGAGKIAKYLGVPTRKVYYLVSHGLPVSREGAHGLVGSKQVLRAHYQQVRAA